MYGVYIYIFLFIYLFIYVFIYLPTFHHKKSALNAHKCTNPMDLVMIICWTEDWNHDSPVRKRRGGSSGGAPSSGSSVDFPGVYVTPYE